MEKMMFELFCPPEGIPATGGEQMKTGNHYPNADKIDLKAHIQGTRTFALDCVYKDESGTEMCRWGVVDVDQLDGLGLLFQIKEYLEAEGINVLMSFSGNKGFHLYILSEPVPKEIMVKLLKKVKARFDFKGEIIPGEASRCKPAPCLHQAAGQMSYLFTREPYPEPFGLSELPGGFYENQLDILQSVQPTPVNVLIKFAATEDKPEYPRDIQDMAPDLSKAKSEFTPCIKALVDKGGAATLGTWDKNSLTLAGYCASSGLKDDKQIEIARQFVKNSENGPVQTSKNLKDRLKHFKSIRNTPSVTDTAFNCAFILKARKELGFNCDRCRVRPKGIEIGWVQKQQQEKNQEPELTLEVLLAKDLIAHILQNGRPVENILPDIMPGAKYNSDYIRGHKPTCTIYKTFISAINDGITSEVGLAKWLDADLAANGIDSHFNGLQGGIPQELEQELRNKYLENFRKLKESPLVDEDRYREILSRAVDMSMRTQIKRRAEALDADTFDLSKDIYTVNSDFTHEATKILSDSQRGAVVPLSDKFDHLLNYILGDGAGKVPTPFPELNDLLGGGLANGSMYVLVSPPGGGKTTMSEQISDYSAMCGVPVIFVSMEMSMEHIYVNAISRMGEMNSAKIMSPYKEIKKQTAKQVGDVAEEYHQKIAPNIYVVEGSYNTTPSRLESMVSMIRASRKMSKDAPFLMVIDYLQLLNTGIEAMDMGPNETIKISELAVRVKQLARDLNVAVLAISDVTKEEQKGTFQSKEFTMNALRGSNRIAHAADCIMVLYSEPAKADGGKAEKDAWEVFTNKVKDSEQATDFNTNIAEFKKDHPVGGEGATVYARLELIKNRGGQGKGNQFLLYHRAFHKFEPAEIDGQQKAEGRG